MDKENGKLSDELLQDIRYQLSLKDSFERLKRTLESDEKVKSYLIVVKELMEIEKLEKTVINECNHLFINDNNIYRCIRCGYSTKDEVINETNFLPIEGLSYSKICRIYDKIVKNLNSPYTIDDIIEKIKEENEIKVYRK